MPHPPSLVVGAVDSVHDLRRRGRGSPGIGWDVPRRDPAALGHRGAANGGYLQALVTGAVLDVTGASDPVTVTTHYFAPVKPGPVQVRVEPLRQGRRLSTANATLTDADGRLLLAALATVGELPAMAMDGPPEPVARCWWTARPRTWARSTSAF